MIVRRAFGSSRVLRPFSSSKNEMQMFLLPVIPRETRFGRIHFASFVSASGRIESAVNYKASTRVWGETLNLSYPSPFHNSKHRSNVSIKWYNTRVNCLNLNKYFINYKRIRCIVVCTRDWKVELAPVVLESFPNWVH